MLGVRREGTSCAQQRAGSTVSTVGAITVLCRQGVRRGAVALGTLPTSHDGDRKHRADLAPERGRPSTIPVERLSALPGTKIASPLTGGRIRGTAIRRSSIGWGSPGISGAFLASCSWPPVPSDPCRT